MRGTSRLIPHGHAWDRADEEVKGGGRPQVYTAGTINGRSLAMEILSLDLSRPRALLKEVFAAPVRREFDARLVRTSVATTGRVYRAVESRLAQNMQNTVH